MAASRKNFPKTRQFSAVKIPPTSKLGATVSNEKKVKTLSRRTKGRDAVE